MPTTVHLRLTGADAVMPKQCKQCGETFTPLKTNASMRRQFCSQACKTAFYNDYERKRWVHIKNRYGVTRDEYMQMLEHQDGGCAICGGGPESFRNWLDVDHCHDTGRVRALLCNPCNRGIAWFKHDASRMAAAAAYLIGHASEPVAWWSDTPEGRVLDAVVTGGTR